MKRPSTQSARDAHMEREDHGRSGQARPVMAAFRFNAYCPTDQPENKIGIEMTLSRATFI